MTMTTQRERMIDRAIRAKAAIAGAEAVYRETLRDTVRAGVPQVELAAALGVSRETLRKSLLLETERAVARAADTEYRRDLRKPEAMRADRKPWPECDCSRPRYRSLFQHDRGCRAVIEFERANAVPNLATLAEGSGR